MFERKWRRETKGGEKKAGNGNEKWTFEEAQNDVHIGEGAKRRAQGSPAQRLRDLW